MTSLVDDFVPLNPSGISKPQSLAEAELWLAIERKHRTRLAEHADRCNIRIKSLVAAHADLHRRRSEEEA